MFSANTCTYTHIHTLHICVYMYEYMYFVPSIFFNVDYSLSLLFPFPYLGMLGAAGPLWRQSGLAVKDFLTTVHRSESWLSI